jgi:Holliday junction resolvase
MPNKNYIKGRRKEYKVANDLKKKGFDIVQRSAGSHSPIDVFAIDLSTRVIKLVQCKPDDMTENAIKELLSKFNKLNGMFRVEYEVR